MPVSSKQLLANRHNAQLGGVKTDEGKAASRMNAVRHNILGQFLADDERKALTPVLEALIEDWQPAGFTEGFLVERIAIGYMKLARLTKAETEQLMQIHNPRIVEDGLKLKPLDRVVSEGYSPAVTSEHIEVLGNPFLRYETTIERSIYRAIQQLREQQAARKAAERRRDG